MEAMGSLSKKTAIVLSGGGMRSAYSGGFLCGIGTRFPSKKPDIMIATSGGSGCTLYYLSDQYDEIRHIWTSELAGSGSINPYEIYRIMSMDFAINTVLRKSNPIFVDRLSASKTDWYIAATEIPKNIPIYFSKKDIQKGVDIYDIIEASLSVPILYGGVKSLSGKKYIDGGVAAPFSETIKYASLLGATHILAIDTSRKQDQDIASLKRDGLPVRLIRNMNIPASLLTHSKKTLTETFMLGFDDALKDPYLDDFFD